MFSTFTQALKRWWHTDPATNGAAIAYYAIFALAPIFIILVVVFGGFFGKEAVEGKLTGALQGFVGRDASLFIQALIRYAYEPVSSIVAAAVSTVVTIIGAFGLFEQAELSLSRIFEEEGVERIEMTFLRTKILAVLMVAVLGALLIMSFLASAFVGILITKINPALHGLGYLITTLNTIISLAYIIILFIIMYKYLPAKPVSWRAAITGGIGGGFLYLVGRFLLGLYISSQIVLTTYGAAGAVVLVLVWFYYMAQVFFFGGSLTYVVDQKRKIRQTSL